jgi:hypothetical protein
MEQDRIISINTPEKRAETEEKDSNEENPNE